MNAAVAGAWDCHVHVFGPIERFPYAAERRYTPPDASPAALQAVMQKLGTARAVLVQPSPYADDHRCLLAGLEALGDMALGVAALVEGVDARIPGNKRIVGLRLNLNGVRDADAAKRRIAAGAEAAAANGWHLELHLRGAWLPELGLESLPVDYVLDHMARLETDEGEPLSTLLALLDTGRCWVKLSGADRVGKHAPALARRLLAARPDRLVWGSDWPHTPLDHALGAARRVDTAALLRALVEWAGGGEAIDRVLLHNPRNLYERRAR